MYCIHQAGINSGNTQAAGFEQVTLITVDDYMQSTGQISLPVVIGAAVGAILGAAMLLVILIVIIM